MTTKIKIDHSSKMYWTKKLKEFIPNFLNQHEVLKDYIKNATILLHGSLTLGINDEFSDIDLWFLLPQYMVNNLKNISDTMFFEFNLNHKKGHLNVENIEDFTNKFKRCHMDTVFQLRNAAVIFNQNNTGQELIDEANKKMNEKVKRAFFHYHYTEMRSEHRACDNPMERNDSVAFLLSLPKVISHALQALFILHKEPYPYDKWLYFIASQKFKRNEIINSINVILKLIGEDKIRFNGPESLNPISQELRIIRKKLIEEAKANGINEPWLNEWWLYMTDADENIKNISW